MPHGVTSAGTGVQLLGDCGRVTELLLCLDFLICKMGPLTFMT